MDTKLHVFENFFQAQKSASKYPESDLQIKIQKSPQIQLVSIVGLFFSQKRTTGDRKPTFHTPTFQDRSQPSVKVLSHCNCMRMTYQRCASSPEDRTPDDLIEIF